MRNNEYQLKETTYHQLADEIMPISSWIGIILTIICTFIFVLSVNFFLIHYLEFKTGNPVDDFIGTKWEQVKNISKPVDWLILGDSTADWGINASVLMENLNGTVENLATVGNWMLIDDTWMLEYLIRKDLAPKNIIIMHAYDILGRDIEMSMLAQAPFTETFWSQFTLDLDLDIEDYLEICLAKHFPLYSRDLSIRIMIFEIIQNPHLIFELTPQVKEIGEDLILDYESHLNYLDENIFVVNRVNERAINIISDLVEKNDISVFVVPSPIYEELEKHPKYQEYYTHVDQWWLTFATHSENIHYIREQTTYPAKFMRNADHLNDESSRLFSQKLSNEILKLSSSQN